MPRRCGSALLRSAESQAATRCLSLPPRQHGSLCTSMIIPPQCREPRGRRRRRRSRSDSTRRRSSGRRVVSTRVGGPGRAPAKSSSGAAPPQHASLTADGRAFAASRGPSAGPGRNELCVLVKPGCCGSVCPSGERRPVRTPPRRFSPNSGNRSRDPHFRVSGKLRQKRASGLRLKHVVAVQLLT